MDNYYYLIWQGCIPKYFDSLQDYLFKAGLELLSSLLLRLSFSCTFSGSNYYLTTSKLIQGLL